MLQASLLYLTMAFGVLPLFFYLWKKRSNKPVLPEIAPLLWLVAFSSVYEFVATLYLKINSDYWFRAYLLLEFCCLFYFFFRLLKGRFRPLFWFFAIGYLLFFLYLLTLWGKTKALETDSYLSVVEFLLVFVCAILWFRQVFLDLEVENLAKSQGFYVISGFVLYFAGTFFLFLIGSEEYWQLNIIMCLVMRILITIGIWKGQTT